MGNQIPDEIIKNRASIMRYIFYSICLSVAISPAIAQNRSFLQSQTNQYIVTNSKGAITEPILNNLLQQIISGTANQSDNNVFSGANSHSGTETFTGSVILPYTGIMIGNGTGPVTAETAITASQGGVGGLTGIVQGNGTSAATAIAPGSGVAAALAQPLSSFGGLIPAVATKGQLSALPSTYALVVVRLGYSSYADAPPLGYSSQNSACSLNSGAGDGGYQVPSSDGKCWQAIIPTGGIDVREWGAKNDWATTGTDNATTITTALATMAGLASSGGPLIFGGVGTGYGICSAHVVVPGNANLTLLGPGENQNPIKILASCGSPPQEVVYKSADNSHNTTRVKYQGMTFDGYCSTKYVYHDALSDGSLFIGSKIRNAAPDSVISGSADVYREAGGYENLLGAGNRVENINDPGHTCYTSQTVLPKYGVYDATGNDDFTGLVVQNVKYGFYFPGPTNAILGPGTHVWGECAPALGPNCSAGTYDLREQYGVYSVGSISSSFFEADDPQIAGIAIANGFPTARIDDTTCQWNNSVPTTLSTYTCVLLPTGSTEPMTITHTDAFALVYAGYNDNIVTVGPGQTVTGDVIVCNNPDATWNTCGWTFNGATTVGNGITSGQTIYVGPSGQGSGITTYWTVPNGTCKILDIGVFSTAAPGAGQTYTATVYNSGSPTNVTETISGASSYAAGPTTAYPLPPYPLASSVGAGNQLSVKLVASAGATTASISFRVFTNCQS